MSDDKPMVFLGTPDDKALIARLRAWYTPGETITGDVALYLEAADTIERLTAERDKCKLQAQYETDTAQAAVDEIERLREENRKLRYEVNRSSCHMD